MFKKLPSLPADSTFHLMKRYSEDQREEKIDLGIGIYHAEDKSAPPLKAVVEAKKVWCKEVQEASYTTIVGNSRFTNLLGAQIFSEPIFDKHLYRLSLGQSLGGTGALSMIAKAIYPSMSGDVYLPTPTWGNHRPIFEKIGYHLHSYNYLSKDGKEKDFDGICNTLKKAKPSSVVVFHASCHNPTGTDPDKKEWEKLWQICQEKELFPLFDLAYAGFGQGIDEDCWSVRFFAEKKMEMGVACSCSKNFGLYRERVGAFYIFSENRDIAGVLQSHLQAAIRSTYSNPPSYGAKLVEKVLSDPDLTNLWHKELSDRRERMQKNREELVKNLCEQKGEAYKFIGKQIGMFSFLPMNKQQTEELIEKHALYLLQNGRINISGITEENLAQVVKALCSVL